MAEKRFAKLGLTVVYKAHKIDREGYTKEGKYYGYSSSQPNTVYEWSIQRDEPWEELAYGTDRATSVGALMTKIKSNHKSAFRQGNPTVTASSIPIGEWSPAHAIRRNADGSVDILREKNSGRRANISEGFMAGGVFHPIRHAGDYDASRVGEGRAYKKKRKKGTRPTSTGRKYAPKKASTKKAMPISRRDYGGDGSRYRNPGTLPTSKKNDVEYVTPDGSKTYSAAKAKRVAKKMAMDLGRNVQIHWRRYSTDKYGSYTVKP